MSEIEKNDVEELLLDNINGNIEDATKELILFSLDVKETVGVSVTTKEVMTLCIDDGTTVEVLMGDLVKKYNYTIDCSALAEKLGEADAIYSTFNDICDLGKKINKLYISCKDYFKDGSNNPINTKRAEDNADPIIFDLNNDGTFSKELESGVHFDFDGDGFAEKFYGNIFNINVSYI